MQVISIKNTPTIHYMLMIIINNAIVSISESLLNEDMLSILILTVIQDIKIRYANIIVYVYIRKGRRRAAIVYIFVEVK